MGGFRGIGDTATEVKMKQDQMGLQAALSREDRASRESMASANLAENARQANMGAAMQAQRAAEGVRQFDATLAAQQEDTAWKRSQMDQRTAEEQRRYELERGAQGRAEQRADRQLSLQEFGSLLSERRFTADAAKDDVQTQMANAQLQQYLAATKEEQMARDNRDRIAKGAFGSLVIAGRLNGGVIPSRAIEIANQQLGDKDNVIVGGGFDENSGIAFFNVRNNQTGEVKQLKMTPDNQYAAIHAGIGKQAADMWLDTFKDKSSARAAVARRKLEFDEKEAAEVAKEQRKLEAERNDPTKQEERQFKRAEMLQKQAELAMKRAEVGFDPDATDAERKEYKRQAAAYTAAANEILMPKKAEPKQFALTPEIQQRHKISPKNVITPRPDGGATVMWKVGKDTYKMDLAPDGTEIGGETKPQSSSAPSQTISSGTTATTPAPTGTQPKTPDTPSKKDLAFYGITADIDANGKVVSARTGNDITGYRDISPEDVFAEYEKRKQRKEMEDSGKAAKKKADEDKEKADKEAREKIRRDYERTFGKGKL